MERSIASDVTFAFGHRQTFTLMAAILRTGGRADSETLARMLDLPEHQVMACCGMLAADRLVTTRYDDGHIVYSTTGAQFSRMLDNLADSYVWRTECAKPIERGTVIQLPVLSRLCS